VERWISLLGYLVMIGLAWLMSSHKRKFPWKVVLVGTALQLALALFILRTYVGQACFFQIGEFFRAVSDFVDAGARFVFGEKFQDFYFAFKVLPTIIFFSSLMAVLYYIGLMPRLVQAMAWVMQKLMGTSGAESLSAAANIFMGQTEAPLVVRPYIPTMTQSELNAIMIGGFANISGSLIAAFSAPEFGLKAEHLVASSVISAPASLLVAKVILPELERPHTLGRVNLALPRCGVNVLEAAAIGAAEGARLAINVAAMLIAFMALIAMINAGLDWIGEGVAWSTGTTIGKNWSLEGALGYLFAPLAWVIGVESRDCLRGGELLGLKTLANEFVAYQRLSEWVRHPEPGHELGARSVVILTYALCGFSNFASIGIQIGGLGAMAPERQPDLARLGLRAMLGGTLATCMTACIAGVLI
jgi:CNT family concentrative nucleoside transporter